MGGIAEADVEGCGVGGDVVVEGCGGYGIFGDVFESVEYFVISCGIGQVIGKVGGCSIRLYNICIPHIISKIISHFLVMDHNEIDPPVPGQEGGQKQRSGDDTCDIGAGRYPAIILHRKDLRSSIAVVDVVVIDDVNEVVVAGVESSAGGSSGVDLGVGSVPTVVVLRREVLVEIENGKVWKIGLHQQIPHIDERVGQHCLGVVEQHHQRGCSLGG